MAYTFFKELSHNTCSLFFLRYCQHLLEAWLVTGVRADSLHPEYLVRANLVDTVTEVKTVCCHTPKPGTKLHNINSSKFSICRTSFWFSLTLSAWSTAMSRCLLSELPCTCENKNPFRHDLKNWQKPHENRQMTICWNICNSNMVIQITGKSKFLTNFLTFSDVPLSMPNIRCRSCYLQLIQV